MKPYSKKEHSWRNSMQAPEIFDRASFDADGGEEEMIENPGDVDESIWKKAKEASLKSYGEYRYAFISYIYQKMGGVFKRKS